MKQKAERKVTGKEQRRLDQMKLPKKAMKRIQVFKGRWEKMMAVQAELTDAMDRNLLQLKLDPNPQNLQALKITGHRQLEVNRQATLWIDEANDFVKSLLDELPPADYPVNPPPPGIGGRNGGFGAAS